MGERVFDQTVYIAPDDSITTTSSDYHSLTISGDTLQLATPRDISSSSSNGNIGEICWGSATVLGVTTHYLYVCYAANSWKRVALSNVLF